MYGINPEDLYGLDKAVQIGEVLIAPPQWFK